MLVSARCITYVVVQELHDEGGHAAVDADEEVDAGQHHVGCAGHAEDEGGGVHQRGDGPPAAREETVSHWVANKELWGGGGVFSAPVKVPHHTRFQTFIFFFNSI